MSDSSVLLQPAPSEPSSDSGLPLSPMACDTLRNAFHQTFGREPKRWFYAPGRVNLMGEHTDYNDGFVLPIAIRYGVSVAVAPRPDRRVCVHSLNRRETVEFDLDNPNPFPRGFWINYVEGVARCLEASGVSPPGADMALDGSVPEGAGLSSSAALENAIGLALASLAGKGDIDRKRLAQIGQQAEHQYVGTRCGVMDQLITAMGRTDHALLIDCRSLETEPIPILLPNVEIVICNTRVKHALADSAYNRRREECEAGVAMLQKHFPDLRSLRDFPERQVSRLSQWIEDPTIAARTRHVVTENARALAAADALRKGDAATLGALMEASHQSLQSDYEVSCPELDALAAIGRQAPGGLGSRMTGGGFGGCTVNLVSTDALDAFCLDVQSRYQTAFGQTPGIYVTRACEGAREILP